MKGLHQSRAIAVVPSRIKAAHKTDRFSDRAPELEIQVRPHVGGAAFERYLIGAVVEAEHTDLPGIVSDEAENQINGCGFACAIWPNQPVDRPARNRQVERA